MKLKRSCVFASVLRIGKKQSRRFGSTQLLLGASLITLVGQQVKAQDLFWDPKAPDVSPSGSWNATDLDFDTAANLLGTDQAWLAGSIANFQQVVGGTVTLVGTQAVSGINASSLGVSNWLLTGGNITVQGAGGIAAGTGDSLTVASAIDGAAAGQALNFTSGGGTVIVSGNIGSNIGVVTSDADLTLSGTNAFTGPLNVNSGMTTFAGGAAMADTAALNLSGAATVVLSNSETIGALSGSAGTTISSGVNTLTVQQATDTTFAGNINGSAGFTKSGIGSLTLSGANAYTGTTLISQGTLNLTGSLASSPVTVNLGATLTNASSGLVAAAILNNDGTVNQDSDDTILTLNNTGKIDGNSTLTATTYNLNNGSVINAKLGTGTVNANGVVAFNGTSAAATFNVVTGNTTLGSAERLLDTTALTISGGASLILGGAEKIGSLNGGGTLDNKGFLLTVDSGAFSGDVFGTGGLTKVSGGLLTLSGVNNYSGNTSVDAGILTLTGAGTLAHSLDVTVATGATLNDNNSGLVDGTVATINGTLNLGANETIKTLKGNGTAALGTSLLTVSDGSFSGVISSAAGTPVGRLTKISDGNLTLSGTNTYTGSTLVNAGAIIATTSSALGAAGANNGTVVAANATVALQGDFSTAERLNITGAGAASFAGAIDSTGNNTLTGQITMTGNPATIHSGSGTLNINGGVTSSVGLGQDVLTFSAASGSTIDVNSLLSVNLEAIRKVGAGTLDLSGQNNDYDNIAASGAAFQTEIVDGVIIVTNDNNLGDQSGTDRDGVQFNGNGTDTPTLRINGNINFEAGNDRQFQIAGPLGQFDVTGAFVASIGNNDLEFTSNTNTLRKLGTGTLNLNAASSGIGNVAIVDGFLDPDAGTLNVLGAGFSGLNPTFGPGGIPLPGTTTLDLAGLGDADGGQTGTVNLGVAGGNEFDNILIDQSVDSIFDGTLNTTGDLTVTGTGNLQLNGTNNIGGNVHVSGNQLIVNNNGALGNNINSHDQRATFVWGQFNDPLIPNALTTPGQLSLDGTGGNLSLNERITLVNNARLDNLAGDNVINTEVRVRFDGSLPFAGILGSDDAQIGATAGSLKLAAGIFSNPGQSINLNGLATDTGTVTVAGEIQSTVADVTLGNSFNTTNTVDLQVQNTYFGETVINGGNVIVGNALSFSGSDVTVTADANLDSSGNVALANDFALNATLTTGTSGNTLALNGEITGAGGITNANGTTTLGGTNTYSGATNVTAGNLKITGSINGSNVLDVANLATLTTTGSDKLSDGATLTVAAGGTANLGGSETLTSFTNSGNVTVSGLLTTIGNSVTVTDPGTLTANGIGTTHLTVTGMVTSTGDITTGALNGAAPGQINFGANTLTAESGTYDGRLNQVSGAGELFKTGGGNLTLNGDNSGLTGKTSVDSGILTLGSASKLGSTIVDISNGGTLNAGGTMSATNINVSTLGTLNAADVLAAGATVTNSGLTSFTGGASTISNLSNLAGGIVNLNGGNLTTTGLNGSGTLNLVGNTITASTGNYGGPINGTGGLTKEGVGLGLTLSGTNSFTGAINVNGGALNLQSAVSSTVVNVAAAGNLTTSANEQLANTATLTADGTVSLGGAETIGTLAGSGTVNAAGALSVSTLNGSAQINAGSNTVTAKNGNFGGSIDGNGGLTKNSAGTLALTAANSYTGTTQINAGTLALSGTLQSTAVNVANGALLTSTGGNLFGGSSLTNNGQVTIAGNETITSYASGGPGATNGLLDGAGTLTASTYALNDGSTVSANTGTGIITSNGAVTINANSTGASAITVQTGVLDASGTFAANQIGVNSGATLNSNGVLAATANVVAGGTINVGGNSTVQSLSITPASGIVNLNGGNLVTTGLNGEGTLNLGINNLTAASGTFSGTIDGAGNLTKVGNSTLTLSGTNSYTGPTNINAGTLSLQSNLSSLAINIANGAFLKTSEAEQLDDAAVVDTFTTGKLTLAGSETIGQLLGAGSVVIGANTLTLTNGGTFSGNISGTGQTIVTGGTLTVSAVGGLNSRDLDIQSGSTIETTGADLIGNNSHVNNDGTLKLGGNDTVKTYTSTGTLNGPGTLTASTYSLNDGSIVNADTGKGIITTNGAVTINSANTGASAITVETGDLDAFGTFAANQIGVNSGATLNSNGILATTASVTVGGTMNVSGPGDSTVRNLSITPASGIVNLVDRNLITTGLNGSGTLNLGTNALTAASGTFSGTIDGAGSLTKVGSSTLTLAGTNSYTGATNINVGTLSLQSDLSSLAINIANGAFLKTSEAEQLDDAAIVDTLSGGKLTLGGSETIGELNGGGSVTIGANTFTLTNGGTFSGKITGTGETVVSGGTFAAKAGAELNSADLDIQSGSTLTTEVANLIGNSVRVNNDGTVTLGGNDTVGSYTSTGTLNGPGVLTASTYKLNDGSVVNTNTGAGIMTTNGLVQLSAGTTTGASAITVQSGILNANGTTLATALTVNTGATLNSNGTLSNLPTLEVSGTANLNTVTVLSSLGANGPGLVEINAASLTTTDLHGDGIVDLNANILNVSEGAFSGTIRGNGTLNKNDAGLLTLSGTNAYTGPTNVNAGILNAETALNTSALNVAAGATYLNTGGLIKPNVTISNNGIVTLFGNEQGSVYDSVGGTLNGVGTLTAPIYNLSNGANTAQGADLGTGILNSGPGIVTLLGNSAANDVNVLSGTLNVGGNLGNPGATVDISGGAALVLLANPALGIDGDIADTGIVNNMGTLTLNGDDLIGIYNANGGALTGAGTVTAGTYNLSNGASTATLANLGEGILNIVDVNPPVGPDAAVTLNGLAGADTVNINLTTTLNLGASERLDNSAVVTNRGTLNLNGTETVGTFISSGTLGGTGTLIGTGNTLTLQNGHTSLVNTMLQDFGPNPNLTSQGLVNINGSNNQGIPTNARINVTTAIIQTGTMNLNGLFINNSGSLTIDFGAALVSGFSDRIADGATVDNGGTWTLGGNDTIASYTSTGLLTGAGSTLTAVNYFLNGGSVVNANIGTGTVQSNGSVALNGTSAASIVNILSGNLSLGGLDLLDDNAAVTNGAMLTLNGNEIVGSYVSNAGNLAGNGTLTAPTFALNDGSIVGAGTTLGDIAMGSSHLTTKGQVQLNGTSNVDKVTIESGSLNGNGALNYALLEGNGILNRSLTNLAGDTVNPGIGSGNIGQLTIAGDFANQGNLVIDLNAQDGAFDSSDLLSSANADRLVVNGAGGTNLNGGHVEFNKVAGSREFNAGESALVIASVAPITMDDFTSFDSSDYEGRMFFDVRNGTVVGAGVDAPEDLGKLVGLTENQIAIAEAADFSISAGDMLDNTLDADKIALAIVGAYNSDSHGALNQLSPESYAGMTDYGIQVTKAYTTAALGLPGTSIDGTVKTVRIPMGTAPAPTPEPVKKATTSVFAGFSHFDTASDSSIDNADYDITSNGGIAGVRHQIADFTIAGFVGIDQGDISSSTLDADADGFLLGAIASYVIQPEMNLIVTGGVTYGSYEYDGDRESLLGTVDFNADSDVFDVHFGIEGDAYRSENFRLSPFLQLHYVTAETDGFSESGNGSALLVDGMDEDAFFAEIGVKAEYQVTSKFSVNGNVGYTHNFMDSDREVSAALGGAAFTVNSPGLGEDFVTLGVGAQYQATENLRFGINYRAEFSNDADTSNGVSIGASFSF